MFFEYLFSILLAAVVGGLIGIEREYRDKTAGFRTMILISVGSSLLAIVSDIMGGPDQESTRIAAGVVTGVGFLGAGVIVKDGSTIRGLTTAASIWLVAALGMGAGIGEYALVTTVAVLVILVLLLLPPFERWIDKFHDFSSFHITIKNTAKAEEAVLDIFEGQGVQVAQVHRTRPTKGERVLRIRANMNVSQHERLGAALVSHRSVISFTD